MAVYDLYQTNFAAGLLDPVMFSRDDLQVYQSGASTLTNWKTRLPSGLVPRDGSELLNLFDYPGRLIEFLFADDQSYGFYFSEGRLDILNVDTGAILQSILGRPWAYSDVYLIRHSQIGDVLVFAIGGGLFKLTRTSATTFTVANLAFDEHPSGWPKYRPFETFSNPGVTLAVSGITGSVNLTTSEDHWNDPGHVGTIVRFRGKQIEITSVTSPTVAVGTIREELDPGSQHDIEPGTIDSITANATADDFELGEVVFGLTTGARGYVREKTDSDTIVFEMVAGTFEDGGSGEIIEGIDTKARAKTKASTYVSVDPIATDDWDEEAFTDYRGWPKALVIHEGRLWLGGSDSLPTSVISSKSGLYFTFETKDGFDNETIQGFIGGDQIYEIRHLFCGRNFQIYTDRAELYAPTQTGRPLSPTNFAPKRQSNYGISQKCAPVQYDVASTFVQRGGKVVREFIWDDVRNGYTSNPISILAGPFFSKGIELNVQYVDKDHIEQYLFVTGEDGDVAVYHSIRGEGVSAWMHWETAGSWKSIMTVNTEVYAIAERTLNGQTKYCFERMESTRLMDCETDAVAPESGSIWTGLSDYANTEVGVVVGIGGNTYSHHLGNKTVDGSGNLDLSPYTVDDFQNVRVGLPFEAEVKPMPTEIAVAGYSSRGEPKRIVSLTVGLIDTVHIEVEGREFWPYKTTDDVWLPPVPFTGEYQDFQLGVELWQIPSIKWTRPLPCKLTGLKVRADFN